MNPAIQPGRPPYHLFSIIVAAALLSGCSYGPSRWMWLLGCSFQAMQ